MFLKALLIRRWMCERWFLPSWWNYPSKFAPETWWKWRWVDEFPFLGGGFKYFSFSPPIWGRWTHFDEHIFQMGWFNHQLVLGFPIFRSYTLVLGRVLPQTFNQLGPPSKEMDHAGNRIPHEFVVTWILCREILLTSNLGNRRVTCFSLGFRRLLGPY